MNTDSVVNSNRLYETALRPKPAFFKRLFYGTWIVVGLSAMIWLGWSEPFSRWFFNWLLLKGVPGWEIAFIGVPAVMTLRGVWIVETIGYAYHRFFQHVGFWTRRSHLIRVNQADHWRHHMIIYPYGKEYQRKGKFVHSGEGKIPWAWVVPALIVVGLFGLTNGFNFGLLVFTAALGFYANYVVRLTHDRFHIFDHPWADKKYFHWLEDIHILHHWDQRTNFTIVHPLMDILFGTYLSPRRYRKEVETVLNDVQFTVSDLINWRYLLVEATPIERAAFISAAKYHKRSQRKVRILLQVLADRVSTHPQDLQAKDLLDRAIAFEGLLH